MYLKKILLMSSLKKPLLFILTCVWSIVFLVSYTPSALAQKFVRCKINDLSDTTANIRNFPSSSRYSLYEEKSQVKFRLANGVVVTVVAKEELLSAHARSGHAVRGSGASGPPRTPIRPAGPTVGSGCPAPLAYCAVPPEFPPLAPAAPSPLPSQAGSMPGSSPLGR